MYQCSFNQKKTIYTVDSEFQNVVCKMAAISSRAQSLRHALVHKYIVPGLNKNL